MLQKPNFLLKLKVKLITMEIIQVMFLRLLSSIQTCFLHPKVILTVCFNDHIILHVYLHSFTKKTMDKIAKSPKNMSQLVALASSSSSRNCFIIGSPLVNQLWLRNNLPIQGSHRLSFTRRQNKHLYNVLEILPKFEIQQGSCNADLESSNISLFTILFSFLQIE